MNTRDEFPAKVKSALRERVGGKCSRIECGRLTVSPSKLSADKVDVTGRAAHITAASPGGPRFSPALTSDERSSAENGIWLCADCADLIDKNSGQGFSEGQIRTWKRNAEEAQGRLALLRIKARRPTWLDKLTSPHYVNVPRLLHMAGPGALSQGTQAILQSGFPRQGLIIRELVEVENALRGLTIEAVDVKELNNPAAQLIEGLVLSFYQTCRTKNGANQKIEFVRNYSYEKSPLIYLESWGYRYIMPYDPAWLTTNTAHGSVRSGTCTFAGLALIKSIDHDEKRVVASPLAFGIPNLLGF